MSSIEAEISQLEAKIATLQQKAIQYAEAVGYLATICVHRRKVFKYLLTNGLDLNLFARVTTPEALAADKDRWMLNFSDPCVAAHIIHQRLPYSYSTEFLLEHHIITHDDNDNMQKVFELDRERRDSHREHIHLLSLPYILAPGHELALDAIDHVQQLSFIQ